MEDAFTDKKVKAIFTAIGGFNSNQLLPYLDYELIKKNPKIFCGYSDITILSNAIFAKTGLVTYYGLHFSTFAIQKESEYNLKFFKKCLMSEQDFLVTPSPTWSDDKWFLDQEKRKIKKNKGFIILNKGYGKGKIIGGNLGTFSLLNGTQFAPDISDSILFIEDNDMVGEAFAVEFDRTLQSLIQQKNFKNIQGIVIGRFNKSAKMTLEKIKYIIKTKKELKNIPVIANADFGHTNPLFTFPIGGVAELEVTNQVKLRILKH